MKQRCLFTWAVALSGIGFAACLVILRWPQPEMSWWHYISGGLFLGAVYIFIRCARQAYLAMDK